MHAVSISWITRCIDVDNSSGSMPNDFDLDHYLMLYSEDN